MFFSLGVFIWSASTGLGLVKLHAFLATILAYLSENFIAPMGVKFFAPVLVWILVTFRKEDWLATKSY